MQFGTSIVPTALAGPEPTIATDSIAGLYLAAANPEWDSAEWRRRRRNQLETVWGHAPGSIGRAARSALRTVKQMEPYARQTYKPHHGVTYPTDWPAGDLSDALKNTAQLIRADVGTEVVAVDYGSWDMHTDVGSVDGGSMNSMLSGFAKVLAAFLDDLDDLRNRVTVVTISEFGRTGRREQRGRPRPRLGQRDAARRRGRQRRPVLREVAWAVAARPRRRRPQGHHRLPQRARARSCTTGCTVRRRRPSRA